MTETKTKTENIKITNNFLNQFFNYCFYFGFSLIEIKLKSNKILDGKTSIKFRNVALATNWNKMSFSF